MIHLLSKRMIAIPTWYQHDFEENLFSIMQNFLRHWFPEYWYECATVFLKQISQFNNRWLIKLSFDKLEAHLVNGNWSFTCLVCKPETMVTKLFAFRCSLFLVTIKPLSWLCHSIPTIARTRHTRTREKETCASYIFRTFVTFYVHEIRTVITKFTLR
jgi:hypothetical protein